jgi:hypothetical protein
MPGEFHRSSVHCVKERLDLEVVPMALCSALTLLGSRQARLAENDPDRLARSARHLLEIVHALEIKSV